MAAEELLEREHTLAATAALIDAACAGRGGCLLVDGAAGMGKTTVLAEAARGARDAGAQVLTARGGELERELPWGVVRDLLARIARHRAIAPAAAAALGIGPSAGADDLSALHALTELCADLAEEAPLVLCVDDAHWADEASARWLAYAAPRLDELAVGLIVAARPADPRRPAALDVLAAQDGVALSSLEPLSAGAGAAIVRERLPAAGDELCDACQRVTGGNPFLLSAVAEEIARLGIDDPDDVADVAVDRIDRVVARRLAAVGDDGTALARALAILGAGGSLAAAAELAGLEGPSAARAADALRAVGVLDTAVGFAHPLVRSAVERALAPGERSLAHADAARLLARDGAPVDLVGAHLLQVEPGNDGWVRERLVVAGDAAFAAGDPARALGLFERALAERSGPPTLELLTRLGRAALVVSPATAAQHLSVALTLAQSPQQRVELALDLASALQGSRRWSDAVTMLQRVGDELHEAGAPLDLWLRVQTELLSQAFFDPEHRLAIDPWLRRAAQSVGGDSDAELGIYLHQAIAESKTGTAARGRELARRAWADGRLFAGQVRESPSVWWIVYLGLYFDDYALAETAVERGLADARRRGSATATAYVNTQHAEVLHRLGRLDDAEAALDTAWAICTELGPTFWCYWITLAARLQSAIARGVPAEGLASLETAGLLDGPLPEVMSNPLLLAMRPATRIAAGDAATGVPELLAAKAWTQAQRTPSPGGWLWPAQLIDGLLALGEREAAIAEAREWLERTERFGAVLTRGMAQRAVGLATGDVTWLERAVTTLAGTPCRAEYARALLEHGAALRRANRREAAREPLRQALDLATRAGAAGIALRAREELGATGARPRRVLLDGIESLTASELRVARLAAEGLSNPEIAAALFITRKTVEKHLANSYMKLGIGSRRELPGALTG